MEPETPPWRRLMSLALGTLRPPPGARRIAVALLYGTICHLVFAAAVIAMIWAMFFGMSRSVGSVPQPWSFGVNALLLVQFPIMHSILLTGRGQRLLARIAPFHFGRTLSTTSYAIIASLQLLALFAFWTPSGVIWWQAEGGVFVVIC